MASIVSLISSNFPTFEKTINPRDAESQNQCQRHSFKTAYAKRNKTNIDREDPRTPSTPLAVWTLPCGGNKYTSETSLVSLMASLFPFTVCSIRQINIYDYLSARVSLCACLSTCLWRFLIVSFVCRLSVYINITLFRVYVCLPFYSCRIFPPFSTYFLFTDLISFSLGCLPLNPPPPPTL